MTTQYHPDLGGDLIPNIIRRYLHQEKGFESLTQFPPRIQRIGEAIKAKKFSLSSRKILQNILLEQYRKIEKSDAVRHNIEKITDARTFTVTSGQQLHPFLGPVFFATKILDTIQMATRLKEEFPDYHFVPIFWMAGEDHDFEEINTFKLYDERYKWDDYQGGAVGRYKTDSLLQILDKVGKRIDSNEKNQILMDALRKAYNSAPQLDLGMQILLNEIFGDLGLVVINPDNEELKAQFFPIAQKEMEESFALKCMESIKNTLSENQIKWQLNPRKINLFRLEKSKRSLITKKMKIHPSEISPNAVLRPIFQEIILPNVAFISGPSELNYWLQLKPIFDYLDLSMPIVFPRNINYFLPKKKWNQVSHDFKLIELMTFGSSEITMQLLKKSEGKKNEIQQLGVELSKNLEKYEKLFRKELPENGKLNKKWAQFKQDAYHLQRTVDKHLMNQKMTQPNNSRILKLKEQFFNQNKMIERNSHVIERFAQIWEAKSQSSLYKVSFEEVKFALHVV